MTPAQPLPESKHFLLEPLTDGVYAAIHKPGGVASSNAGIVDLGDRVLIFDTFMSPQAARDLVHAAAQVTQRPVAYAVNSHWHPDHVGGNQVLPPGTILISTHQTRALIAERIPAMLAERRQTIPYQLNQLETQLQSPLETQERLAVGDQIDLYRMVMEDLPQAAVRLPNLTFERRLVLSGPARRVELLTFGGGHTASDAILYLPDDQIAFVADLLYNEIHPWLGDGDPDDLLRILGEIDALEPEIEVIVPGHGAVTKPSAFGLLRRYIPALRRVVDDVLERGGTLDDALAQPIPAAFAMWPAPDRFKANLQCMFGRQAAK